MVTLIMNQPYRTNRFIFPTVVLLAADRKIAGQVLGPDGKPFSKAHVDLAADGQPNGHTMTDASGYFAFDALSEGTIRLSGLGLVAGNFIRGYTRAQAGDT